MDMWRLKTSQVLVMDKEALFNVSSMNYKCL